MSEVLPPRDEKRQSLADQMQNAVTKPTILERSQARMAELLEVRKNLIPIFDTSQMISGGDAQVYAALHNQLYKMTYPRIQLLTQSYATTIQAMFDVAKESHSSELLYENKKEITITRPGENPDNTWFINFRYKSRRVPDPDLAPIQTSSKTALERVGIAMGIGGVLKNTVETASFILADTNNLTHLHMHGFAIDSFMYSFLATPSDSVHLMTREPITGIKKVAGIQIEEPGKIESIVTQLPNALGLKRVVAYPLKEKEFQKGKFKAYEFFGLGGSPIEYTYQLGRDGFIRRRTTDLKQSPLELEITEIMDSLPFEKIDNSEAAAFMKKMNQRVHVNS